jgi:hypothetical protein
MFLSYVAATAGDDGGWMAVAVALPALGLAFASGAMVRARATGRVGVAWRLWLGVDAAVAALLLLWALLIWRYASAACNAEGPGGQARCAAWVAEQEARTDRWALGMAVAGLAIVGLLVAWRGVSSRVERPTA